MSMEPWWTDNRQGKTEARVHNLLSETLENRYFRNSEFFRLSSNVYT